MNFELSDEQQALRDLARQIMGDIATVEHVRQVEATGDFDRQLWDALSVADLLGLCLPGDVGGSGYGVVELALLLEEQGRVVSPVPLLHTVTAAMALAASPSELARQLARAVALDGAVLTSALATSGVVDPWRTGVQYEPHAAGFRLAGFAPMVPYAQQADHILVPARNGPDLAVFVAQPGIDGVTTEPTSTTNREPTAHVHLNIIVPAHAQVGGGSMLRWLMRATLTSQAALQVGIAEAALALTAGYVATRQQFGRPLASFQAVSQRAADAYIATEAMRVTAFNAAWRLAQTSVGGHPIDNLGIENLDLDQAILSAAYWADRGAQDVTLAAQHLHGGIGADIDYPVHRYFLWASQLASRLGGASSHLQELGRLIAATAKG